MPVLVAGDPFYYDEITQRPMLDGRQVMGATDVLKLGGIMDGQMWGSDYDLWMGQARHAAVELWVKGTLDLNTLDVRIQPSLEAFLQFQDETGFNPTHSEYKVYNPVYRVATRIDLMGEFPDGAGGIIELKSGTCAKPTAIQTAIQDILLGSARTRKRYGLSIPKTGRPVVSPYKDRDDYTIAISAMNIAAWKVKNLGAKF
jgi:hypothetical protein